MINGCRLGNRPTSEERIIATTMKIIKTSNDERQNKKSKNNNLSSFWWIWKLRERATGKCRQKKKRINKMVFRDWIQTAVGVCCLNDFLIQFGAMHGLFTVDLISRLPVSFACPGQTPFVGAWTWAIEMVNLSFEFKCTSQFVANKIDLGVIRNAKRSALHQFRQCQLCVCVFVPSAVAAQSTYTTD